MLYLDEDDMVYYVFRQAGTVCFCLFTDEHFKICNCLDDDGTVRYVMFKTFALHVLYLYLLESASQRKNYDCTIKF